MNKALRILILAVVYSGVVALGAAAYCGFGIYRCSVGQNLSVSDVLVPVLLLVLAMGVVGAIVAGLIDAMRPYLNSRLSIYAVVGALIGALPRFVTALLAQPFGSGLYPHIEYVIFFVAGALVAVTSSILASKGALRINGK